MKNAITDNLDKMLQDDDEKIIDAEFEAVESVETPEINTTNDIDEEKPKDLDIVNVSSVTGSRNKVDNGQDIQKVNYERKKKELNTDFEKSRSSLDELLKTGMTAVDSLALLANESEECRPYEVLSDLVKNISDLSTKLLDLHERRARIEKLEAEGVIGKDKTSIGTNINNAVFVGNTDELMRMIKDSKAKEE
jgi:hypothetical protein